MKVKTVYRIFVLRKGNLVPSSAFDSNYGSYQTVDDALRDLEKHHDYISYLILPVTEVDFEED